MRRHLDSYSRQLQRLHCGLAAQPQLAAAAAVVGLEAATRAAPPAAPAPLAPAAAAAGEPAAQHEWGPFSRARIRSALQVWGLWYGASGGGARSGSGGSGGSASGGGGVPLAAGEGGGWRLGLALGGVSERDTTAVEQEGRDGSGPGGAGAPGAPQASPLAWGWQQQ